MRRVLIPSPDSNSLYLERHRKTFFPRVGHPYHARRVLETPGRSIGAARQLNHDTSWLSDLWKHSGYPGIRESHEHS